MVTYKIYKWRKGTESKIRSLHTNSSRETKFKVTLIYDSYIKKLLSSNKGGAITKETRANLELTPLNSLDGA